MWDDDKFFDLPSPPPPTKGRHRAPKPARGAQRWTKFRRLDGALARYNVIGARDSGHERGNAYVEFSSDGTAVPGWTRPPTLHSIVGEQ